MQPSFPSSERRTKWPNSAELRSSSGLIVGGVLSPASSSSPSSFAASATASDANSANEHSTAPLTFAKASSSINANPHDNECASAMATVSCMPMVHLHGLMGVVNPPPPASSSFIPGPKNLPCPMPFSPSMPPIPFIPPVPCWGAMKDCGGGWGELPCIIMAFSSSSDGKRHTPPRYHHDGIVCSSNSSSSSSLVLPSFVDLLLD
mmetsp:Transcript_39568/g.71278  ORF Transcript_39568/g.71278 Transcript_39568/m.71278 type:complete len:205 (+) Transcript_39568:3692-4306(+)